MNSEIILWYCWMDSAGYENIKSKHLNAFGNKGSTTLLIKKPHLRMRVSWKAFYWQIELLRVLSVVYFLQHILVHSQMMRLSLIVCRFKSVVRINLKVSLTSFSTKWISISCQNFGRTVMLFWCNNDAIFFSETFEQIFQGQDSVCLLNTMFFQVHILKEKNRRTWFINSSV